MPHNILKTQSNKTQKQSNSTQVRSSFKIHLNLPFPPCRVDPIPYDTPKPAGHTRFVCVSDTHSRTDGIQMPYGDVLLHTGDFTELGLPSEVKKFNDWLGRKSAHAPTNTKTVVPNLLTHGQV